jgi:microcystin-dependent protein
MSFWKWSRTAGTNATADGSINWAEGQSPSSVNDGARAMMAAAAKYRDDIAGAIVTGGTSTAYTVASYQVFDTLAHLDGMMIAFAPHTTSGASPPNGVTLNVDGLGGKPLRLSPGVELVDGALIQGTPYVATYNNSDGAFYLRGFSGAPYQVPLGGLLPYIGATAPNSAFALPFGQAISRTTYATLFTLVSTTFGAGDGSTTFNLPDLRGRLPAGVDNMGGSAASRIGSVVTDGGTIVGATLGSVGGSATHALITAELAAHSHTITDAGHQHPPQAGNKYIYDTGGTGFFAASGTGGSNANTGTATTGITINNAGSGSAHALLQPTIMLNYILRVI